MNSNLTVRPYQPVFKANFSDKFLNAADKYYSNTGNAKKYKQFCSAVRRFAELPNSDDVTIDYKSVINEGKREHILFASKLGESPVVLTAKDQFRKVLEKFSYMSEFEFNTKMAKK